MVNKFSEVVLDSNITLHVKPIKKFKTNQVIFTLMTPLDEKTASLNAILPMVLRRGTNKYQNTIELDRALDYMYGANLYTDVRKTGELQMLIFSLEIADKKFLPDSEDLLPEGIKILIEMLFKPALKDGLLREDYVDQEKQSMIRLIESVIDDKQSYATKRCFESMCEKEKYGVYKYGRAEDVAQITAQSLTEHYNELIRSSRIDLFIMGDVDLEEAKRLANENVDIKKDKPATIVAAIPWSSDVAVIREVTETMDVNHGKLVIGMRNSTTYAMDDYPALMIMNGVLGAFSHSKLFQNVREKSSLAYYAYSGVEAVKGIMVMSAGIDSNAKDKALKIMLDQLEEVKKGNVTQTEMDFTLKALINKIKVTEDHLAGDVDNALAGLVTGRMRSADEMIEDLKKVTKEDVVRVANGIVPDTVYFLRGNVSGEGAENEN